FIHAGAVNEVRVNVRSLHSEHIIEDSFEEKMQGLDGVLVAPGFGERGIEGKVRAVQYAREHGIPFLGICLGMQMAVIEYARNVLGLKNANSTEMDENTPHPVIDLMEEQKTITNKGGTMRLGAWDCELKDNTLTQKMYHGATAISERHRHRYELNNEYKEQLEAAGMVASGINKETGLVEVIELPNHPWFIGVQYHPEYKSTVASPHPLFVGFVKAVLQYKKQQTNASLA
ncbi:MAG: CTP synthase, partial [Eudoraea sp.]|nr:CTP synthase [Eudoraea sp.]